MTGDIDQKVTGRGNDELGCGSASLWTSAWRIDGGLIIGEEWRIHGKWTFRECAGKKALERILKCQNIEFSKDDSIARILQFSLPSLWHGEVPLSAPLLVVSMYYLVVPCFECDRVSRYRSQSRALPLVGPTP